MSIPNTPVVTTGSGSIQSITFTNCTVVGQITGYPITYSNYALHVSTGGNDYLTISNAGEVHFTGKMSTSMKYFINYFEKYLDIHSANGIALSRSYKRGLKHCLEMLKDMPLENVIEKLKIEIDKRSSKEALLILQREE